MLVEKVKIPPDVKKGERANIDVVIRGGAETTIPVPAGLTCDPGTSKVLYAPFLPSANCTNGSANRTNDEKIVLDRSVDSTDIFAYFVSDLRADCSMSADTAVVSLCSVAGFGFRV